MSTAVMDAAPAEAKATALPWVRNIEEKFGVKIPLPVIADLNKEVATLYGMIMPGESKTETSRAVFVIDEKGIVRAMDPGQRPRAGTGRPPRGEGRRLSRDGPRPAEALAGVLQEAAGVLAEGEHVSEVADQPQ
jgi:hypothetical protein